MLLKLGDRYTKKVAVGCDKVSAFADVSGDYNPIHLDDKYAETTIFKRKIAHGMLICSFISAVIGNEFPGNGAIYLSNEVKFLKPVFVEDEIIMIFVVKEILPKDKFIISTEILNSQNSVVLISESLIKYS